MAGQSRPLPSLHRLQPRPLPPRYFPHRDGLCSRGCPSPLHAPLGCQNQPPAIKGALSSHRRYHFNPTIIPSPYRRHPHASTRVPGLPRADSRAFGPLSSRLPYYSFSRVSVTGPAIAAVEAPDLLFFLFFDLYVFATGTRPCVTANNLEFVLAPRISGRN